MRAIIIDPKEQTVTETDIENSLEGLQKAIGDRLIQPVPVDSEHVMYVDEEGLFVSGQSFFTISSYPEPLAGKAVIVGENDEGESVDATLSTDAVKSMLSSVPLTTE